MFESKDIYVLPKSGMPNLWHIAKKTYPGAADLLCGGRVAVLQFITERPGGDASPTGVECSGCRCIASGMLDQVVYEIRIAELRVLDGLDRWLYAHERSMDTNAESHIDLVKAEFEELSELRKKFLRGTYASEMSRLREKKVT